MATLKSYAKTKLKICKNKCYNIKVIQEVKALMHSTWQVNELHYFKVNGP